MHPVIFKILPTISCVIQILSGTFFSFFFTLSLNPLVLFPFSFPLLFSVVVVGPYQYFPFRFTFLFFIY